jgi:23S rRNA (cytidine1920-2'-O)/16S rRNA (cytidine1409-2'-O)-methyltransferase
MRLDQALVARRLARSRSHAQGEISAGLVRVNGRVVTRPAKPVTAVDRLDVTTDPYVSRAAHKVLGALDDVPLAVRGRVLDAGASTGGFTQVLLERGAEVVYAVDVGHGQLAPLIRSHPRVVVWERTNLRDLTLDHVGGSPVNLIVADVSFISLTMLIGPLSSVVRADGDLLLLVKPQFEVGRERLGKTGVVRSADLHASSLRSVLASAEQRGWHAHHLVRSRLPGPAGNLEFFVHLRTGHPAGPVRVDDVVAADH